MATRPAPEPIISGEQIAAKVRELARRISEDCAETAPVLLIVLKGALYFGADLARAMTVPVVVEFIRAESYTGSASSGSVEICAVPRASLADQTVFIVEDILDSGLTAKGLLEWVQAQKPESVRFVTLLDKPDARQTELRADYVGFTIPNVFVVGYGLDYEQAYRELPGIHRLLHEE